MEEEFGKQSLLILDKMRSENVAVSERVSRKEGRVLSRAKMYLIMPLSFFFTSSQTSFF